MSGIAGEVCLSRNSIDPSTVSLMIQSLLHRGSDDERYLFADWATGTSVVLADKDSCKRTRAPALGPEPDQKAEAAGAKGPTGYTIALSVCSMAQFDRSESANQPMSNENGALWILNDGEIYNHRQLRRELSGLGHAFKSQSSSEVILHAYEEWGPSCPQRFNGIWAFVIWDVVQQVLMCSRDRFGAKPLFYFFSGDRFLFGSEIKALLQANVVGKPNDQAIYDYLAHGLVDHTEQTFFSDILSLPPGCFLRLSLPDKNLQTTRYYRVPFKGPLTGLSDAEYAARFSGLFEDAVRLRLYGDGSLGALLSGGLDSSSIVCVLDKLVTGGRARTAERSGVTTTFSARYQDDAQDEGEYINEVVAATAVSPLQIYPTAHDLAQQLDRLIWHQEQPFLSTSTYAEWAVFQLVGQCDVRAVFHGQGGDELLAGYDRFFPAVFQDLLSSFRWLRLSREWRAYHHVHRVRPTSSLSKLGLRLVPRDLRRGIGRLWGLGSYRWLNPTIVKRMGSRPLSPGNDVFFDGTSQLAQEQFQAFLVTGGPAMFRYADRNSMAHSVQVRLPFLDHRLVELMARMPNDQKIRDGQTKYVLRTAMKGTLPEAVRGRQDKKGFPVPQDAWLRALGDWVSGIVRSDSFSDRGYLEVKEVNRLLETFLHGESNLSGDIWRWICLELWFRRFID